MSFFKKAEIALAEAAPAIGRFRIFLNLFLKESLGAHPFILLFPVDRDTHEFFWLV